MAPSAGLADAEHPLYRDAVYVLDSLSTVKSVALVCDLPNASNIIIEYFQKLWSLTNAPLAKNVELAIIDVLIQLIDESVSVPQPAVEILMMAFADDTHTSSYMAAVSICRATQDRLQKHVARYFSEALIEAHDEENDEVSTLEHLHTQIVHVAETVPSLLTSVIPQLEIELQSDHVHVRLLATRALGTLFMLPLSEAKSFAALHPHVWKAWLGRAVDKQVSVREAWIESAMRILAQHAELAEALAPYLEGRAVDPDEHVRAKFAELVGEMEYETLCHRLPLRILQELALRGKDRRELVRERALDALGKVFNLAYTNAGASEALGANFRWIPGAVLNCHLTGSSDVTRSVLHTWETHIVPINEPEAYARRLNDVALLMSESDRAILLHLTNLRLARPTAFDVYVDVCQGNDAARLPNCIRAMSAVLNDPSSQNVLNSFASAPDDHVLNAMRVCFDVATPLRKSMETRHEAHAYLVEHLPEMTNVLMACLWTGSFPILNVSCMRALIDLGAAELLSYTAEHAPYLLKDQCNVLMHMAVKNSQMALDLLATLVASSSVSVKPSDTFINYVAQKAPASYAAARILAHVAPERIKDLMPGLQSHIEVGESVVTANALEALAAMLESAASHVCQRMDMIADHILHKMVLAPWQSDDNEALSGEWVDDCDMPASLRLRLGALRVLTQWCIVQNKVELALPVLKLLWILLGTGEAQAEQHTPSAARARLRLYAAQCILRLATCEAYASLVVSRMGRLAYALQDECFHVRTRLLHDLLLHLLRQDISTAFHAVLFLVAFDPEDEPRTQVVSYTRRLRALPESAQQDRLECVLVRFLYLLAHHPDLDLDVPKVLCSFVRYVSFYLACVATEHNISTLAHYAASVRTYLDASAPEPSMDHSKPLHAVAELMQWGVQQLADSKAWTIYPVSDDAPCPSDIVRRSLPGAMAPSVLDQRVWDILQEQPKRREKKTKLT